MASGSSAIVEMNAMPFQTAPIHSPVKNQRHKALIPGTFGVGLALIALTTIATNSETIVASGFERAFANLQNPPARTVARAYDGVSGTEEFWLRSHADALLVKAVAVGNHLTVSAADGAERRLIITSVANADDGVTHIQTAGNRALLITCREGHDSTSREVQFRLDAGQIVEIPQPHASQSQTAQPHASSPVATQRAL